MNPTENGSPLWVTAARATTVFADFNNDGVADATYPLAAYGQLTILDPDGDQSGAKVYTTDGVPLAVAWGQDHRIASGSDPALDAGATVLPLPALLLAKRAEIAADANANGRIDPGDAIRYVLTIANSGAAPIAACC